MEEEKQVRSGVRGWIIGAWLLLPLGLLWLFVGWGVFDAIFGSEPTAEQTARFATPTPQPQQGLVVENITRDQVGTLSDTQVLHTFVDCWEKDEFGWESYRHGLNEYLRDDLGISHRWNAPGDIHEWIYTLALEYGKPGLDAEYELYGFMQRGLRACLN